MIPRYDKKEISSLWSEKEKFSTYLEIELAILKSLEGELIPPKTSDKIRRSAIINPSRIHEIEEKTHHDVIAFCTSITENLDAETGKFFHFGVTSSDIIDSATTLQIKRSLEIILKSFKKLLFTLHSRAEEMKDVICMGRSHGMDAEPMSFGQKLLGHYNEFSRRYQELLDYSRNELTLQFSGAVGNYTILTPEQEKKATKILGLKVEPLSTQVIPRDRIAKLININALIGGAIERLCVEIRHLHRSDSGELHEGFKKGQKGSSTMPHKKNPISSENLTGMARVLRSHPLIAQENMILWHERDISHSSAERLMLPDNLGILFYALTRLNSTVENLIFHRKKIEKTVREKYTYLSSYYLHHLIKKTNIKREDLYCEVQKAAFETLQKNHPDQNAQENPEYFHLRISQLMEKRGFKLDLPQPNFEEIKKIYTSHVEEVFTRSLREYPLPHKDKL